MPAILHEGWESGVGQPHLLKAKGFRGFRLQWVLVKHDRAVVKLDPKEVVNFSGREKQSPFSIAQSSIQQLFNGGLPSWAFVGPRETGVVKT